MKTKKYMHVETGSIDTRSGWESSYDPEELAERELNPAQAFEEDEGQTLIEVSNTILASGGAHNAPALKIKLKNYLSEMQFGGPYKGRYIWYALTRPEVKKLENHFCMRDKCDCNRWGTITLIMGEVDK